MEGMLQIPAATPAVSLASGRAPTAERVAVALVGSPTPAAYQVYYAVPGSAGGPMVYRSWAEAQRALATSSSNDVRGLRGWKRRERI